MGLWLSKIARFGSCVREFWLQALAERAPLQIPIDLEPTIGVEEH